MSDHVTADKIYDVAVRYCGATENHRDLFAFYAMTSDEGEYRFGGNIGMGGKIYFCRFEWRIACYPEDERTGLSDLEIMSGLDYRPPPPVKWVALAKALNL